MENIVSKCCPSWSSVDNNDDDVQFRGEEMNAVDQKPLPPPSAVVTEKPPRSSSFQRSCWERWGDRPPLPPPWRDCRIGFRCHSLRWARRTGDCGATHFRGGPTRPTLVVWPQASRASGHDGSRKHPCRGHPEHNYRQRWRVFCLQVFLNVLWVDVVLFIYLFGALKKTNIFSVPILPIIKNLKIIKIPRLKNRKL